MGPLCPAQGQLPPKISTSSTLPVQRSPPQSPRQHTMGPSSSFTTRMTALATISVSTSSARNNQDALAAGTDASMASLSFGAPSSLSAELAGPAANYALIAYHCIGGFYYPSAEFDLPNQTNPGGCWLSACISDSWFSHCVLRRDNSSPRKSGRARRSLCTACRHHRIHIHQLAPAHPQPQQQLYKSLKEGSASSVDCGS